jgi:hypothetical protein
VLAGHFLAHLLTAFLLFFLTNVGGWTVKGFGETLLTRMEYVLSCINNTDVVTMDMVELINVSKCMYRGGFLSQLLK